MAPVTSVEKAGQLVEADNIGSREQEWSCPEEGLPVACQRDTRELHSTQEISNSAILEALNSHQRVAPSDASSQPQPQQPTPAASHQKPHGQASVQMPRTLSPLNVASDEVSHTRFPGEQTFLSTPKQTLVCSVDASRNPYDSSTIHSKAQGSDGASGKTLASSRSGEEYANSHSAHTTNADLSNVNWNSGCTAASQKQCRNGTAAEEPSDEAKDAQVVMTEERSVIYNVLEKLFADRKLGRAETNLCKHKLIKLYTSLVVAQQKEQDASDRAVNLTEQLEGHREKLEKLLLMTEQNRINRADLEQRRKDGQAELAHSAETEKILEYQIGELRREKDELEVTLAERTKQIQESFCVLIDTATAEIDCLKAQKRKQEESTETWKKQRAILENRQTVLNKETTDLLNHIGALRQELENASEEPLRQKVQGDQFEQVITSLRAEMRAVEQELTSINQRESQAEERLKKLENQVQAVTTQLKAKRGELLTAEDSERSLKAKLGEAKLELLKTLEGKRVTDLQAKERKTYCKMLRDLLARQRNLFNQAKLYGCLQQENQLKEKRQLEDDIKRKEATRRMLAAENQSTSRVLAEQDLDMKERLETVDLAYRKAADLERELQGLKAELDTWTHHVYTSMTHKEKIIRGVAAARQRVTETQTLANIKRDEEKHLRKCQRDLNKSISEFQKLLDSMRGECNKYINLKQKADQQAAEMAERHRILSNEVETLRLQEEAKTNAIEKTKQQTQKAAEQRSWLRSEQSLLIQKVKEETQRMEEYMIEIDRLNNIVNMIEREMLDNKTAYESAVESRSLTGLQLIDRNDEICLLWEKSSALEKAERASLEALRTKEKDVAALELYLQELQRQIFAKRKRSKEIPRLKGEVNDLEKELERERHRAECISVKLENPIDGRQWNDLGGDDMDMETLNAKYQALERRFRSKKRELMDKDLDLEELTDLTTSMREKAEAGREGAVGLLSQIQELQTKLAQVERKGMVVISELKLYKNALPRFIQMKDDAVTRVEQARANLYSGRPPTPNSEEHFEAIIEQEYRSQQLLKGLHLRKEEGQRQFNTLRTTAEPRPTQYIPDDGGTGLPVAYGANPPFKPFPNSASAASHYSERGAPGGQTHGKDNLADPERRPSS